MANKVFDRGMTYKNKYSLVIDFQLCTNSIVFGFLNDLLIHFYTFFQGCDSYRYKRFAIF